MNKVLNMVTLGMAGLRGRVKSRLLLPTQCATIDHK